MLCFVCRAIKGRKPVLLAPLIPLGIVGAYQYDMAYGTLIQRMKGNTFILLSLPNTIFAFPHYPYHVQIIALMWNFIAFKNHAFLPLCASMHIMAHFSNMPSSIDPLMQCLGFALSLCYCHWHLLPAFFGLAIGQLLM